MGAAAPAPDDQQRAAGHGRLRRRRRTRRRLPPRLPLRHDPRRRAPGRPTPTSAANGDRGRTTGSDSRSPTCEALRRTRDYLAAFGVATGDLRVRSAAAGGQRASHAIRTRTASATSSASTSSIAVAVVAERRLAQGLPRRHLRRRGLVRAMASADREHRSCDPRLDRRVPRALRLRRASSEVTPHANGLTPPTHPRRPPRASALLPPDRPCDHAQAHDPGRGAEVRHDTEGEAIEPLGLAMRLFDITTGTGDFIANGVVSHNCFARPTHTYLDIDAGRDFEREIVVKVNVPEVLRAELGAAVVAGRARRAGDEHRPVPVGRGALQADARDLGGAARRAQPVLGADEVAAAAARPRSACARSTRWPGSSANLSVPTLDEKAWRATEPHTPNPRARLEAVAELNRAGHPHRRADRAADARHQRRAASRSSEILELATEAGATSIGGIALHLRGEVRGIFFDWLRAHRPELLERYERALPPRRVRPARGGRSRAAAAASRAATERGARLVAPDGGRGERGARARRRAIGARPAAPRGAVLDEGFAGLAQGGGV